MKPIKNIQKLIGHNISPYQSDILIQSVEEVGDTHTVLHTSHPIVRLTIFWKQTYGCQLTIEAGYKSRGYRIKGEDLQTPQTFIQIVRKCMTDVDKNTL